VTIWTVALGRSIVDCAARRSVSEVFPFQSATFGGCVLRNSLLLYVGADRQVTSGMFSRFLSGPAAACYFKADSNNRDR
jgi:hypothetical protein